MCHILHRKYVDTSKKLDLHTSAFTNMRVIDLHLKKINLYHHKFTKDAISLKLSI